MTVIRLLLVEDEPLIAQNEKLMLENLGHIVTGIASSGEKALRSIEEEIPDLVLMDIMLRGEMDGIELADIIRKQHDIPVVFVTAYADEKVINRAKLSEPFGYVVKPIDQQSLSSSIEMALYKHTIDQRLRASEEKFRLAMDVTNEGLWDWEVTTGSVYFSPGWIRILGKESVGNSYLTWTNRIHPADKARILNTLQLHMAGETIAWNEEHRLRNDDGAWIWVRGRGRVVKRDAGGNPLRMIGTMIDITSRKQMENDLLSEKQLSEEYINSLPGLFYVFDEQRFVRWNREWNRITGYSDEELGSMYSLDFVSGNDRRLIREQMLKVFREGAAKVEVELVTKDGQRIPYYFTGQRKQIDGRNHLIGFGLDITERKCMENELEHLATHDPLTGLYNRNMLVQRLSDDIHRATRYKHTLSVFMVDIDHFKSINDTHGHRAGDTVLHDFAKVLESSIRKTDYASRYGGEEFVIILPETSPFEAEELAERVRRQVAEHPFRIEDDEALNLTASIGIATFPEHAHFWQDLLEVADTAMYAAKKAGRNQVKTP